MFCQVADSSPGGSLQVTVDGAVVMQRLQSAISSVGTLPSSRVRGRESADLQNNGAKGSEPEGRPGEGVGTTPVTPESDVALQVSWTLGLYLALACLTLGLAFARFALGPWYHTYRPPEVSLLEGWPASWEVVYYTDQFPNFLGNAPARFGLAPVHYRTFTTLYLATLLYSWTGSAYWSFAVVDLLFWWLAGVAAHRLAIRLGAGGQAAAMSAVLVITSPLLVSHMWRQDLHPANFASMSLGSWAAVTLIDEARYWWQLTLSLAFLLLLLSLSYQYQWSMVP